MHGSDIKADGGGGSEPRVTTDEAMQILSNETRRLMIEVFRDVDRNHCTQSHLVDELMEEMDVRRRRIALTVHHDHLPRLADHGIVEYDQRNGDIRYRRAPRIEYLIDAMDDFDDQ